MKRLPRHFFSLLILRLLKDEEGQATTEYILILAVVCTFLISVVKKLLQPMFAQLLSFAQNFIEKKFFGADLHFYRISGK